MMLGGLNILRIYQSTAHLLLGIVFIAVGGSVLVHMLWGWTRYVVEVRRERSGHCVHCGYALRRPAFCTLSGVRAIRTVMECDGIADIWSGRATHQYAS